MKITIDLTERINMIKVLEEENNRLHEDLTEMCQINWKLLNENLILKEIIEKNEMDSKRY